MKKLFITITTLTAISVNAATLKVGVLAPEGSSWAIQLKDFGKKLKAKTNGGVKIKYYFGGSQGDEPNMLKKIRIGQLHGAVFTGKTLGDIYSDIRIMEVPFTFYGNHEKAMNVLEALTPHFNSALDKRKFKNLGFVGLGGIYFVSKKKTPSLKALQGVKIWSWEGDKLVGALINSLSLISVPVPLPDVLNAMQTGILEAAYAPPVGIIALQWDSKANYIVDLPLAFSIGAFLISHRGWKKISPANRKIVKTLSKEYLQKIDSANRDDNIKALAFIKSKGIEPLTFPKEDISRSKEVRADVLKRLQSKYLSPTIIKKVNNLL